MIALKEPHFIVATVFLYLTFRSRSKAISALMLAGTLQILRASSIPLQLLQSQ